LSELPIDSFIGLDRTTTTAVLWNIIIKVIVVAVVRSRPRHQHHPHQVKGPLLCSQSGKQPTTKRNNSEDVFTVIGNIVVLKSELLFHV
jgi:hypothetical protein